MSKRKKIYIHTTEAFTLSDFAYKIANDIEPKDAALFIAMFEKCYQSWEVTEKLIQHFKALENDYKSEIPESERDELPPKKIL